LFGGTMQNKVVQTLAKAFVQNGWRATRFNFRGVGASEGAYDEGRGEVDDLMCVINATCETGATHGTCRIFIWCFMSPVKCNCPLVALTTS
jgi:alpha/beta superfamily hydrolase